MEWQIECEGVWKIFGPDEKRAFKEINANRLGKQAAQHRLDHVVGVADANFKIRRGEIFCIMGLSGSGKSTLLRHINRLIEPTAGTIRINGEDVSRMDRKALTRLRSKTVGMVFQHMALWPHRNIQDNVGYGLEVQGVPKAERRRIAREALENVRLSGWEEHYPDELSGGMQQRVGLARALASDPDILLMDEPFSALDPLIRRELQNQFIELSARLRKTTLFITHDLEEAIRLGDRVAIMRDGVIVQIGTREEIILNPADEYVAAFVQPMSQIRFVTAEQLMEPFSENAGQNDYRRPEHWIPAEASLADVIERMATVRQPVGVMKGETPVGLIDSYKLLKVMSTDRSYSSEPQRKDSPAHSDMRWQASGITA